MSTKMKIDTTYMLLNVTCVNRAVKTFNLSKRYINVMLRTSIINILYHRLNLPESDFLEKAFNGVPYRVFKTKTSHPLIIEYFSYMTACKDAIEHNYLKEIYIFFIDKSTGKIFENYRFTFKYALNSECKDQNQAAEDLTDATTDLLKALEELCNFDKVDVRNIQVNVELTYYDETPQTYEPPGFKPLSQKASVAEKLSPSNMTIGKVYTGYHMLKLRAKGDVFTVTPALTPAPVVDDLMTEDDAYPQDQIDPNIMTEESNLKEDAVISRSHNDTSSAVSPFSVAYQRVNCTCELNGDELDAIDLIDCRTCKRTYHAPCQGFFDKTFVRVKKFVCSFCQPMQSSDPSDLRRDCAIEWSRLRLVITCQTLGVDISESRDLQHSLGLAFKSKVNTDNIKSLFNFEHKKFEEIEKLFDAGPFGSF